MKKCVVLFSGGLDSRLAVKIMQEQNFEVTALFFKLAFGCSFEKDVKNFIKENKCNLKTFDCTRGKLLQEYLECIKKPKYGRGAGINPCVDCKIFMFKKAKEFADKKKIDLVVSGEVLGERPMSQMKKAMDLIEEKSGLKEMLLRPLCAKLLPETIAEKKSLVKRKKLYDIQGRKRDKQIALAKKFKIEFPHPAGGCLLCEKTLKNRFKFLVEKGMNDYEIKLVGIGRHFFINNSWIVLGRNKKENQIIEKIGGEIGELIIPDIIGPSALIIGGKNIKSIVKDLIKVYSKKGSLKERKEFEKYRL
ncbi:hypothetical protein ACFLZF_00155 [Nanoarchaeota archaeon]